MNINDVRAEIADAIEDYTLLFPIPYELAPNLKLASEAIGHLALVVDMINTMPILEGASAAEPYIKIRLADLTAITDVATGVTHPSEWTHDPCKVLRGEYQPFDKPYIFSHSPHHWTDYQDGRDPLRITHWCNGETTP